jgi:hypothetical protein
MLLMHFAWALATFEGFFIPDSISQKNNNPGNLRPVGASSGFQRFETPELGWERLLHQIKLNISRDLTLKQFFLGKEGVYPGYAPLGDNAPEVMKNYLNYMSDQTGIPLTARLADYFPNLVDMEPRTAIIHKWLPPQRKTGS